MTVPIIIAVWLAVFLFLLALVHGAHIPEDDTGRVDTAPERKEDPWSQDQTSHR